MPRKILIVFCACVGLPHSAKTKGAEQACKIGVICGSGGNSDNFIDKLFIGTFPCCTILSINM